MPEPVPRYETDSWRPELEGFSRDVLPFYHRIAQILPMGARMVEVGTALGRSAIYMAERLVRKGDRDARIYCVDTWGDFAPDWWDRFLRSLLKNATSEERRLIYPVRRESDCVSEMFASQSLSFVFLDGSHDHASVAADLRAWWGNVHGGGIFAGHDYDHEGVQRAVEEYLGLSVLGGEEEWKPGGGFELADTVWWRSR